MIYVKLSNAQRLETILTKYPVTIIYMNSQRIYQLSIRIVETLKTVVCLSVCPVVLQDSDIKQSLHSDGHVLSVHFKTFSPQYASL